MSIIITKVTTHSLTYFSAQPTRPTPGATPRLADKVPYASSKTITDERFVVRVFSVY